MQELRNLFSLMVGSKRKYVDPSRAVEILKDAFKSSESQQVSLFVPYSVFICCSMPYVVLFTSEIISAISYCQTYKLINYKDYL